LPASSPSDPALFTTDLGSRRPRFERLGRAQSDALIELFERNSVPGVLDAFDPFPLTAEQARWIATEPREDAYYAAVGEGRLLGMSMLRGFDAGYTIPSFGIFVDQECQGRGLGRRMTEWTIEQARLRKCPAVRLSVYAANAPAVALYKSLGFAERERQTVERKGDLEEKIIMSLDLGG
jgi:ribosomal protein S18 acetylase RimI-like enzyme